MPHVHGRPELISRLFQNLLGNAIKFRHPDRRCQVSIRAKSLKNDMVQVSIRDNGIGIHDNMRETAFNLFYKYHPDPNYKGVGAGLALARRIVNVHGGTIGFAETPEGQGATVVFTLQAAREQ